MNNHQKQFIEDVKELLAECLPHPEEDKERDQLENMIKDVGDKWWECGFCHGAGSYVEWEERIKCGACFGLGGHY